MISFTHFVFELYANQSLQKLSQLLGQAKKNHNYQFLEQALLQMTWKLVIYSSRHPKFKKDIHSTPISLNTTNTDLNNKNNSKEILSSMADCPCLGQWTPFNPPLTLAPDCFQRPQAQLSIMLGTFIDFFPTVSRFLRKWPVHLFSFIHLALLLVQTRRQTILTRVFLQAKRREETPYNAYRSWMPA